MAKRKRTTTENSIKKKINEGRGVGRLADYKPWLYIQDVPSQGLASRIKGWKTDRVHHLLSLLELAYFYLFEWAPRVLDIREQYPLLPLEETLAIADCCGIAHPLHPRTKHPIVMTTDFVNTLGRGTSELDEPRTIKYRSDLASRRTLEKLEIERRYWKTRKKPLAILTDENLPKVLVKNVEWFHPYRRFQDFTDLDDLTFSLLASNVMKALHRRRDPLSAVALKLDDQLGLQPGMSLSVVRYLLANRHLQVDMTQPINPREPLRLINC
jgi:hypothetical protein